MNEFLCWNNFLFFGLSLEDRGEFTGNSEENTVRFLTMTENEKSILSTIRAGQIRPCIKILNSSDLNESRQEHRSRNYELTSL